MDRYIVYFIYLSAKQTPTTQIKMENALLETIDQHTVIASCYSLK